MLGFAALAQVALAEVPALSSSPIPPIPPQPPVPDPAIYGPSFRIDNCWVRRDDSPHYDHPPNLIF